MVTREWRAGDQIEFELPMEPQRVVADPRIKANEGLVALKYGALVYNLEAVDNHNIDRKLGAAPLRTQWRPDLLGGVVIISGQWADGTDFLAIPNYARMNRVGPPHAYPREEDVDSGSSTTAIASTSKYPKNLSVESKVWV